MDKEYTLLATSPILLNMLWACPRPGSPAINPQPDLSANYHPRASTGPLHHILLAVVSAKHRPCPRVHTSCTCHASWWGSIVLANVAWLFLHRKILPNLKFFSTLWWITNWIQTYSLYFTMLSVTRSILLPFRKLECLRQNCANNQRCYNIDKHYDNGKISYISFLSFLAFKRCD